MKVAIFRACRETQRDPTVPRVRRTGRVLGRMTIRRREEGYAVVRLRRICAFVRRGSLATGAGLVLLRQTARLASVYTWQLDQTEGLSYWS